MCKIHEFDSSKLLRDGCTRCMIDCYCRPSALHFIAINASNVWQDRKRGSFREAARQMHDSHNLISLKAVVEDWKWIGGV